MIRTLTITLVMTSLSALTGCSSLKQPDTYIRQPTVCIDKNWYGYHKTGGCPSTAKAVAPDASKTAAGLAAPEQDRQRLADELEAARRQNNALSSRVRDLERQLANQDRDRRASFQRRGFGDTLKPAFCGTERFEPVAKGQRSP